MKAEFLALGEAHEEREGETETETENKTALQTCPGLKQV